MLASRSRITVVALVICAFVASISAPAFGAGSEMQRLGSGDSRRLQATQAKLKAVQRELAGVKAKASAGQSSLDAADRQVAVVLDAVEAAEEAVQRQRQQVQDAKRRLEELRHQERRAREVLRTQAATLHKQGRGAPFAALLDAQDPADALRRASYLSVATRVERRGAERVSIAQVAVAAQRQALEARERQLQETLAQQRAVLAQVQAIRDSRAAALSGVSARLAKLQAEELHLTVESRRVAALARRAAARSSRAPGGSVDAVKGDWTWPSSGKVTSEYGRRWGRRHEGIDIGAPTGAAVVAASGGVVSFVGRMSGYGNMTLIDHGGGVVTAYAHQSRFMVRSGQRVGVGQRIGSIGCTGNCTGPHLHFEVRVNGSPRNPRRYLP